MKRNDLILMQEWLDKLKDSDKIIIVEGKKDKAALISLGIADARIMMLDTELFLFAEKVGKRASKAIILTDLDPEGKKLYYALKTHLTTNGVEVDNYFREFLFKNSDLSHIEGIDTYFRNLSQQSIM